MQGAARATRRDTATTTGTEEETMSNIVRTYFVEVRGPDLPVVTSDGDGLVRTECWHAVYESSTFKDAHSAYDGWGGSTFCHENDIRMIDDRGYLLTQCMRDDRSE